MSDERKEALAEIAAETLRHLTWLQEAGVREVPRPDPRAFAARAVPAGASSAARQAPDERTVPPNAVGQVQDERTSDGRPPAGATDVASIRPGETSSSGPGGWIPIDGAPSGAASASPVSAAGTGAAPLGCGSPELAAIRADLGDCRRCKLAAGRTTLVYGVGSPTAELLFVGEGPGADEDAQGEPFVGRAGQLLTKMIEAMGYRRDEVYIANVVKCRPPGNRNPEPDEIEACEPFLRRQIDAVKPKVIVALGKFAAQTLLRSAVPITKLRGTWSTYGGVKLMPTFHPAYLLRSPDEKKKAWADLQLVMAELGKGPKGR